MLVFKNNYSKNIIAFTSKICFNNSYSMKIVFHPLFNSYILTVILRKFNFSKTKIWLIWCNIWRIVVMVTHCTSKPEFWNFPENFLLIRRIYYVYWNFVALGYYYTFLLSKSSVMTVGTDFSNFSVFYRCWKFRMKICFRTINMLFFNINLSYKS